MNIREFLSPDDIVELQLPDKQQLLSELATLAAGKVAIPAGQIAAALAKREALGSTGMGDGAAIPHARFNELREPFGIFARLQRPIDFDAIDGERVDLVFVLLLPEQSESAPLGALAAVARKLRSPGILARLRKSKNMRELYQAMLDDGPSEMSERN
jgi:PTS system nitrogen regulatory IIA component